MAERRYPIAETEELAAPGTRLIEEVDGQEIAIFNVAGEYHAVANYCIHEGGPLCEGEVTSRLENSGDERHYRFEGEECVVHCPWHNWKFDVTDGVNTDDDGYRVPTYDVEVEDGTIYVTR